MTAPRDERCVRVGELEKLADYDVEGRFEKWRELTVAGGELQEIRVKLDTLIGRSQAHECDGGLYEFEGWRCHYGSGYSFHSDPVDGCPGPHLGLWSRSADADSGVKK